MKADEASPCCHCARDLTDIEEYQESMLIQFRAGYGSVFGDGNVVTGTLCQYCVQEILGPFLVIQEDDPFQPKIKLKAPRQAFQPNQLSSQDLNDTSEFRPPTEDELRQFLGQLNDDQNWDGNS